LCTSTLCVFVNVLFVGIINDSCKCMSLHCTVESTDGNLVLVLVTALKLIIGVSVMAITKKRFRATVSYGRNYGRVLA